MNTSPTSNRVLANFRRAVDRTPSAESRTPTSTENLETLAAVNDRVLSADEVNDAAVGGWTRELGIDGVSGALLETTAERQKASTPEPATTPALKLAGSGELPRRAMAPARPSVWSKLRGPLALAASLVLGTVVIALLVPHLTQSNNQILKPGGHDFALKWPKNGPALSFNGSAWGRVPMGVDPNAPDWGTGQSITMGNPLPTGQDRSRWQMATVIIKIDGGFGSGAIVSPDGWILTNYHVTESVVQAAAVTGGAARVQVITAEVKGERLQRRAESVSATVYRVDPRHDLALVKLDAMPAGVKDLPSFELADKVSSGDDCFAIGSQGGGAAWAIRRSDISAVMRWPDDLSEIVAGVDTNGARTERTRGTVIETGCRISPGDSGGPLLNDAGRLIGLTFATSTNMSAGSKGYHIGLEHLRAMLKDKPAKPEGSPPDVWTAGVEGSLKLEPQLADLPGDAGATAGHALMYRFAQRVREPGADASKLVPLAVAMFLNFTRPEPSDADKKSGVALIPLGVWGMEDMGRFTFDVLVMVRSDDAIAVGYTNAEGVVDQLRVGKEGEDLATLIWRRDAQGIWRSETAPAKAPLIDASRLTKEQIEQLRNVAGRALGTPKADKDSKDAGKPKGK